jgi:hypothetical protein
VAAPERERRRARRGFAGGAARAFGTALVAIATSGLAPVGSAAQPERTVSDNTVVSQRDPAVSIKLPSSAQYVGADRFLLHDPSLGAFDDCELHAFVESPDGHSVHTLYWVQFEAYMPSQPSLHHTYDSPRHLTIGGLDFYLDTWVSSASKAVNPDSDDGHLEALLASRGYQRADSMSVRLVHLTDATKRKELMIIYTESLAPTGYAAAQLKEDGANRAAWTAIEEGLIRRARQSLTIASSPGSGP